MSDVMTYQNPSPLRYLVLGTGRCGTGFMARLLTSAGVACGHEAYFGPGGLVTAEARRCANPNLQGESSWLAAPFTESPWLASARVIHVVRDPLFVISSFLRRRVFHRPYSHYALFAHRSCPAIVATGEAPLLQAIAHCLYWNRLIEASVGGRAIRHRVEDPAEGLLEKLGLQVPSVPFADRMYNGDGLTEPVSDVSLSSEVLGPELLTLRREYGYA